jgi:hypothetical protein
MLGMFIFFLFNCEFNPMGESCKTRRKEMFNSFCIIQSLNPDFDPDILLPNCLLIYLRINECPPESKLNQAIGRPK